MVPSVHNEAKFIYNEEKKTYNQKIKPPGELYWLAPLFLLWWRYLQKDTSKPKSWAPKGKRVI